MKNLTYFFLISYFSSCIISCAKEDGSSETSTWHSTRNIGTSSDFVKKVTLESSANYFSLEQTNIGLERNINLGTDDIFLVKHNSPGSKKWTEQLRISDNESGISLVVDSFENIYVTGYTKGVLDGNTNSVNYDVFMEKYNSSGIKQWTKNLGKSSTNHGVGMTLDSFDNLYVTGFSNRFLDRGIHKGGEEIVLMKYNPFGTKQWTKNLGIHASEFKLDVILESSDNIKVIGFANSIFDENFDHLNKNFFLVKYNLDGVLQ